MEIKLTVEEIRETKVFSDKFKNREMIGIDNSNSQYPQPLSIMFAQDKVDLLDNIKVGDEVNIQLNLRGKRWDSPQGEVKYFNTIEAWRIDKVSDSTQPSTPAFDPIPNDDLPF